MAARAHNIVPRRSTVTAFHQSSGSATPTGPSESTLPAHVTSNVGGPTASTAFENAEVTDTGSVTSIATGRTGAIWSPSEFSSSLGRAKPTGWIRSVPSWDPWRSAARDAIIAKLEAVGVS